jgi:hypothetical protein
MDKSEAFKNAILRIGQARFGPPDQQTKEALEAILETITDIDRLDELCRRMVEIRSWHELMEDQ